MRISDWSSDVCSSDLLFDSGRHALYDFPFFTDVDDTRADTSAKLQQFRDSFLVAIFTTPPDNHHGYGAGEPASKTPDDARITPRHERHFSSKLTHSAQRRVGTEGVEPGGFQWSPCI